MSHKAAKKIRKLLNATMQAKDPNVRPCTEREYTENTKNRKKQLVELKTGETKEIEVSYGTMRVNSDTGRGIYKIVKKTMTGRPMLRPKPTSALAHKYKQAEPDDAFMQDVQPLEIYSDSSS